ncbi:MAG: hypothetical protein H6672_19370 [Anaerolineaceae bacterium]|nr:hypothetical protein [Anaerolineaceae bacterium]
MFPEDRVLVGVINRKRDLAYARDAHWYRIPQARMSGGVHTEYVAFFLSRAFKDKNGGIHYYARRAGVELVYRRDLLPEETDHPRAQDTYYKVQLGALVEKTPPILNPSRRSVSFIYTTWDRFVHARQIGDLYSQADYFVDRIYHALRNRGIQSYRTWDAQYPNVAPEIRVLCEHGPVVASTESGDDRVYLDQDQHEDKLLALILARIAESGGPVYLNVPLEGWY